MRGPPPFGACTAALRAGGGGFVGGPACRPRRTAAARQSWPRSSPAWGPAPIRAGVPTPSKVCAKNPHCAPPRAARPMGPRVPWRGLAGFAPARRTAWRSPSPLCLVLVLGALGFTPSPRLPGSRGSRGEGGKPALGLLLWAGASPALISSPLLPRGPPLPRFAVAGGCLPSPRIGRGGPRPPPAGRAARYTEGGKEGEPERETERPRRQPPPPAMGRYRALPASLLRP